MSGYMDEQLWEAHQSVYEPGSRMPFEWAEEHVPHVVDSMRAVAERVRGEERERCAQIAEYAPEYRWTVVGEEQSKMIAAAIRAVSAEQEPLMPYMIVKNYQPLGMFPRVGLDHGCIECRNEFGGKIMLILAPGQWDSVQWIQEEAERSAE